MTESDYSIKPLPNLPNVTGLNPAKGNEGRNKRQNSRKRSEEKPASVEDERNEFKEDEFNNSVRNDTDDHCIDYCA